MSPDTGTTVTLRARCLCKAHAFTASLPASDLPLKAGACHCDSCRHNFGALCFVDVPWPNKDEDLSALHSYTFSVNTTIYSCPVCSTQLFFRKRDSIGILTGVLENTPGLVEYEDHIFVGDTRDGGCSTLLRHAPDGTALKRWRRWSGTEGEELPESWPDDGSDPAAKAREKAYPEFTPLWCHCRGVKLFLRNGLDLASASASGSTGKKSMSTQPDPETGKYTAHADACDSCRLHVGTDIAYWAFAAIDHLSFTDQPDDSVQGSSPPLKTIHDLRDAVSREDKRLGTLTRYTSSPGIDRYHCSTCSATFFYTEPALPDQVDIAIGVLDHPDGARAEGILKWDLGQIDHIKDTHGGWRQSLAEGVLREARLTGIGQPVAGL